MMDKPWFGYERGHSVEIVVISHQSRLLMTGEDQWFCVASEERYFVTDNCAEELFNGLECIRIRGFADPFRHRDRAYDGDPNA